MGLSMMPTMTAAMQSVPASAIARTSTAMNIIRQGGASIGTAILSVILASQINSRLHIHARGGHGGFAAVAHLSPAAQAHIKGPLASAFAHSFVYAVGLLRGRVHPGAGDGDLQPRAAGAGQCHRADHRRVERAARVITWEVMALPER